MCSAGRITGEMGRPAEGYLNPWFPLLLLLLLKQVLEITAPTQTHIHTHTLIQRDFHTWKCPGLHRLCVVTEGVHFLIEESHPLALMQQWLGWGVCIVLHPQPRTSISMRRFTWKHETPHPGLAPLTTSEFRLCGEKCRK